jgi:hypothetical protein
MELYKEGYKLKENEFLLKLRESDQTIFLTKLTQKGDLPVKFNEWGLKYNYELKQHIDTIPLTYIFQETFREGWKLVEWRFGMSQNWAKIQNPEGYKIEIYLDNFLDILQNDIINHGYLEGSYMWSDNKLIKKQ